MPVEQGTNFLKVLHIGEAVQENRMCMPLEE